MTIWRGAMRMKTKRRTRLGVLLLAMGLGAGSCSPPTVVAAPAKATDGKVVTVVGIGEAVAVPDLARVSVGVEVRRRTVQEAMAAASARTDAIFRALAGLGIPKEDLQTSSFTMNLDSRPTPAVSGMLPPPPPPPPEPPSSDRSSPPGWIEEFVVHNTLEITVRELSKLADVLSQVASAGATQAWGISFDLRDREPLLAEARNKAMADARTKAEQLASQGSVKLGRVLTLSDGTRPPDGAIMLSPISYNGPQIGIEAGRVKVVQSVIIVYELR